MDRYSQLFLRLNKTNQGSFIPFVILGDPDPQLSLEIIDALIAGGADALELGIPFTDPLADGPTIQDAILRAFNAGITVASCFDLLAKIRQRHPQIPVGLLMYANLVFSQGIDAFYARCAAAGVDSVLIADVPLEESQPFRQAAQHHNIAPVFICPPNASDELLKNIATWGKGYTYLLSRAGVIGTENRGVNPLHQLIEKLKSCGASPALQGFGISTPGQVKTVLAVGAEGAISGSAIVKIIEQFRHQPETLVLKLTQFVSEMKSATQRDKVSINITTS